jgi:hypothetical protein
VAANSIADLDRRLGQIDSAIEEAAKRGQTNAALSARGSARLGRRSLTSGTAREWPWPDLKAIRWLIALISCCDPLAIALTAVASTRR